MLKVIYLNVQLRYLYCNHEYFSFFLFMNLSIIWLLGAISYIYTLYYPESYLSTEGRRPEPPRRRPRCRLCRGHAAAAANRPTKVVSRGSWRSSSAISLQHLRMFSTLIFLFDSAEEREPNLFCCLSTQVAVAIRSTLLAGALHCTH